MATRSVTPEPLLAAWTHAQLVTLAAQWLYRQGCSYVFDEYGHLQEKPDALGYFGPHSTVLVECKVSRSDFRADLKKPWRKDPAQGLGEWRYYLAPRGLLTPSDLPERWGLLEVLPTGTVKCVHGTRVDSTRLDKLLGARSYTEEGLAKLREKGWADEILKLQAWGDQVDAMRHPERNTAGELAIMHSALRRLALKNCMGVLKTSEGNRVLWREEKPRWVRGQTVWERMNGTDEAMP